MFQRNNPASAITTTGGGEVKKYAHSITHYKLHCTPGMQQQEGTD